LGLDSTLAEAPVKVSLAYTGSFEAGKGDLELSVEPEGEFGIMVFSKVKQKDSDELLGQRPQNDQLSTQIKPQIDLDSHHAWIKYRASMGLKGGAPASPGAATLKLKAGKTFSFLDYRRHSPEDKLVETVKADVRDFRLALNLEDVLKLEPGDALAYRVEGELGGSVGLQWSEIFSANIEGLSSFAEASGLLSLSIPVKASVKFKYSVEDEFIVVFSRDVEDHSLIRIAVGKADRSSRSAGAGLSVKIGFADPELVEESILETLLPGRIGQSVDLIDEVLDKASLEDLTKRQLALVREAFQKGVKTLQKAIADKRSHREIEEAFEDMVRFWNQPFFVRTLGNYLVRVADDFADIGPKAGRTLSVTVKGQCHTYSQVESGRS
ncbi:MAG TPA: hypothetical protein VLV83_04840, partial [Acidobacteriota bacterium]|nr:hypothetical protein [Acidobacteriota bacterium]